MKHLTPLAIAATWCISPGVAPAWNGPGHQTIGLVAWSQLSGNDQARAVELLKDHPRFDQHFLGRVPDRVWKGSRGEQDQWVFAHAGTWPDMVRSRSDVVTRDDARRFNRSRWHYVNLPVFLTPNDREALRGKLTNNRETEPPDDPDDNKQNVVQAIGSSLRILGDDDARRADRAVALCWFLHLAGDSHQPCHAAALFSEQWFPDGDRGGNRIPVRGSGANLHALWDASILPARRRFTDARSEAIKLAAQHHDAGIAASETTEAKQWLVESWRLAKTTVYSATIRRAVVEAEGAVEIARIELEPDYRRRAGETSKIRAVEAGFRIAAMLSEQLPPANGPSKPIEKPGSHQLDAFSLFSPSSDSPRKAELGAAGNEPATAGYWLNTKSNARHNRSCRWFGKTARGRYCGANEGRPCGQCGG